MQTPQQPSATTTPPFAVAAAATLPFLSLLPLLAVLVLSIALLGCAATPTAQHPTVADDPALTRAEADTHADDLWQHYLQSDEAQRLRAMLDAGTITHGDDAMPIHVALHWDEDTPVPDAGYPVYISMHGGGAFTPAENDEQWAIQQERYPAIQGLYICPRSARDTWDHWHERHMFALIDTLVRAVLLRDDIDPDRIYLLGYCSGGNGVYQLGPILADRWAAVSATKGIPEGPPLANLRNCPIDLQWGEADPDTIDRPGMNRAAADRLYALHDADRGGYTFREIEHWRQGRFVNDKSTVNWLARFTRDPYPDRVVWEQNGESRESSNPLRHTFYYLAIDPSETWDGTGPDRITADLDRAHNAVHLTAEGYDEVRLRLNDAMLDLDRDITVTLNGRVVHDGPVQRRLETLRQTLEERGDPRYLFPVELVLPVPAGASSNRSDAESIRQRVELIHSDATNHAARPTGHSSAAAEEWVELPLTQGEVLEGGTVIHLYPGSVVSYRDIAFPDSEPTVIRCGEDVARRSRGVSFDFVVVSVIGQATKEVLVHRDGARHE